MLTKIISVIKIPLGSKSVFDRNKATKKYYFQDWERFEICLNNFKKETIYPLNFSIDQQDLQFYFKHPTDTDLFKLLSGMDLKGINIFLKFLRMSSIFNRLENNSVEKNPAYLRFQNYTIKSSKYKWLTKSILYNDSAKTSKDNFVNIFKQYYSFSFLRSLLKIEQKFIDKINYLKKHEINNSKNASFIRRIYSVNELFFEFIKKFFEEQETYQIKNYKNSNRENQLTTFFTLLEQIDLLETLAKKSNHNLIKNIAEIVLKKIDINTYKNTAEKMILANNPDTAFNFLKRIYQNLINKNNVKPFLWKNLFLQTKEMTPSNDNLKIVVKISNCFMYLLKLILQKSKNKQLDNFKYYLTENIEEKYKLPLLESIPDFGNYTPITEIYYTDKNCHNLTVYYTNTGIIYAQNLGENSKMSLADFYAKKKDKSSMDLRSRLYVRKESAKKLKAYFSANGVKQIIWSDYACSYISVLAALYPLMIPV